MTRFYFEQYIQGKKDLEGEPFYPEWGNPFKLPLATIMEGIPRHSYLNAFFRLMSAKTY